MNAGKSFWVIYVVAFDDTSDSPDAVVEPYVGRELIESAEDAPLAALLRGGQVVATLEADEQTAEFARASVEAEVLRWR